jgi:D-alanyl-lipoteichoic acid acyltransferase DltB (MBOAT superfamily)
VEKLSFQYLAFALAATLASRLFTARWWREGVLLAASIVLLRECCAGLSIVPFAGFLAAGYLSFLAIGRIGRGFPAVLIAILVLFAWLKKYLFFPPSVLLHFPYLTLGLSYILFRVLHLLIDTRQGLIKDRVRPFSYLNYTINFTTLVSGPIQRYQDWQADRITPLPLTAVAVGEALERIVVGCFKLNVLSLSISSARSGWLAALSSSAPQAEKGLAAAALFASYPLFLYCNFSGYIDAAIGIGRLMGMRLPENFNRPFFADSFIGFWGRWHITLSEWLRTYVYNPLLMASMRRYPSERLASVWAVGAFFVTFFLIGLWHGQTSVFLFFGFLQGLGVSVNKLYQIFMAARLGRKNYKAFSANPVYVAFSRGLTFTWFAFTLIWFWSDWRQIAGFVSALSTTQMLVAWTSIFFVSTAVLALWEGTRERLLTIRWDGAPVFESRYLRTAFCTALTLVVVVVMIVLSSRAPDIVYKAF